MLRDRIIVSSVTLEFCIALNFGKTIFNSSGKCQTFVILVNF